MKKIKKSDWLPIESCPCAAIVWVRNPVMTHACLAMRWYIDKDGNPHPDEFTSVHTPTVPLPGRSGLCVVATHWMPVTVEQMADLPAACREVELSLLEEQAADPAPAVDAFAKWNEDEHLYAIEGANDGGQLVDLGEIFEQVNASPKGTIVRVDKCRQSTVEDVYWENVLFNIQEAITCQENLCTEDDGPSLDLSDGESEEIIEKLKYMFAPHIDFGAAGWQQVETIEVVSNGSRFKP